METHEEPRQSEALENETRCLVVTSLQWLKLRQLLQPHEYDKNVVFLKGVEVYFNRKEDYYAAYELLQ